MSGNVTVNEDVKEDSEMSTQMKVSDGSMGCDGDDSNGGKQSDVQEECRVEEENQKKSSMNSEESVGFSGGQEVTESGDVVNSESGSGNVYCTAANNSVDNIINIQFGEFAKDSNEVPNRVNDVYYAKNVTKSLSTYGNKLYTIPTSVNSKGEEVVVFDEELEDVDKVWAKRHSSYSDEMCFFKFKDEEGMKYVIGQSPWIVNGKPPIVQKWDPETVIEKETPCKILVWIRLYNVPLEAWSIKGRLGYARVLIEVDAEKEYKEYLKKIEINYVDSMNMVKMTKWPTITHLYMVVASDDGDNWSWGSRGGDGDKGGEGDVGWMRVMMRGGDDNGYGAVGWWLAGNPPATTPKKEEKRNATVNKDKKEENMTPPSLEKIWNVGSKNMKELRKSANKYKVLSEEGTDKDLEDNVCHDDRLIVDSNTGAKRRGLWKELIIQKQIVKNKPWVILGDFNVTLNAAEHSSVDFNSLGQNLKKKPKCKILKKLDRILINDEFMQKCQTAYGIFLPYMVSGHSPFVLHIKNRLPKKKSSFRFSNFVADKTEFLNLVDEVWKEDVKGCYMYKIVKKLKRSEKEAFRDKDTAFFHGILKLRRSKSRVHFIKDESLSNEEAMSMIGDVTNKEIKEAMFEFDSNKASGPDGFTSEFFRKAQDIIGMEIYLAIKEFFYNNILRKFGFHRKMVTWIMTYVRSTSFFICLNGKTHGYFKRGGGLRHGDPMSPYLFTLFMEVFSLIMEKNIKESNGFGYHFGCKELKISHICFPDDSLVLCKANKDSIEVIKKSLKEFSKAYGLVTNLGVSDCKVVCDKVEERINNWRKKLSYAGRIQLIASILSSMQQYWASIYLLPTFINDLEKSFKKFLWNAGDSARGKARVYWKVVCRLNDQGGLGIKSLKKWNEVLLIKKFWKIIEVKNSLWCMDGPLCSLISRRDIYDARLDDNAKVSDMISNNQWNWPIGWKEKYVLLNNLDGAVTLSNKDDKVLWVTNAEDKVRFTTKQAWEDLRDNWPLFNWRHDVVDSMVGRCGKNNIGNVVDKLIFAAGVYFIWRERTFRLFKNESRSEDVLINIIYDSVRSKLMTVRVKKTFRTDVIAKK
uniref:Reverse transcriptase domain-containing protein n=1 Tax=Tanacetum cinerariifolium TaxID=118510 RepID=A0A6L2KIY2_TANCI|nr:hypothetical protein [Tanacetum cinerariifolium]